MQLLNHVVSFNLLDPTSLTVTPWSFSRTPPYNANFEWLQYDTSNFYENIGFITVIVLLLLMRQFILAPLMHWFTQVSWCSCIQRNDRIFSVTFIMAFNIWMRFILMTYFELLIACATGIYLERLLPRGMTMWDKFAFLSAKIAIGLVTIFPLILYLAIWSRRERTSQV